jgi:hypothetical protein
VRHALLTIALIASAPAFAQQAQQTQKASPRSAPAAKAAPAPAAAPEPDRVDRAEVDRTQITGNRELPKVIYIVPWKKPVPGEMSGRPVASVLDEALAPVDRDVFRRQVQYDAQLSPSSPKSAAPATPAR